MEPAKCPCRTKRIICRLNANSFPSPTPPTRSLVVVLKDGHQHSQVDYVQMSSETEEDRVQSSSLSLQGMLVSVTGFQNGASFSCSSFYSSSVATPFVTSATGRSFIIVMHSFIPRLVWSCGAVHPPKRTTHVGYCVKDGGAVGFGSWKVVVGGCDMINLWNSSWAIKSKVSIQSHYPTNRQPLSNGSHVNTFIFYGSSSAGAEKRTVSVRKNPSQHFPLHLRHESFFFLFIDKFWDGVDDDVNIVSSVP